MQSQSHYGIQSRSTVKHERTGNIAAVSAGVAMLSLGTGLYILYLEEEGKLDSVDPELGLIVFGISVLDFVTYYFVDKLYTVTKRTQWQPAGTAPGTPEPIPNHPVTISLPLFRYQGTYHTDSYGRFIIPATELIDKIPNLEPALRTNSIKIDTSTTVDGQEQQDSVTISRFRNRRGRPVVCSLP